MHLIESILLAAGISIGSYFSRFLTLSGAAATFLLAVLVYGVGSWAWTLPILAFFVSSSLLSRLKSEEKGKLFGLFKKSSRRDAGQVFSNGGVAGLLILVWSILHQDGLYLAYLGAVSAVTADTWSTEIGVLSTTAPRSVISLAPVATGTSGGITGLGLIAGCLGSTLIFLAGLPWLSLVLVAEYSVGIIFLVLLLSGIVGNLLDSFLGAALQAQYRCDRCGKITERKVHCDGEGTLFVRGKRWMTNDVVNFLCSVTGTSIGFIGIYV